ncbi:ATP-dependent RNA helicase [Nematocida sp. AWRm80]|nr:ATP-dependent RNA helicase [Nematocida sp. AWRm80]
MDKNINRKKFAHAKFMTEREVERKVMYDERIPETMKQKVEENEIEDEEVDLYQAMRHEDESASRTQMIAGVIVTDEREEDYVLAETFESMGLNNDLLKGVYGMGFETPSPIQMTAIVPLIKGRDLRAQAQSGTGKTAAFGIASIQVVDPKIKDTQVIIMETTRELAIQTCNVLKGLAEHTKVTIAAVYGGINMNVTIGAANSRPNILVGTPGRLLHMIDICKLTFNNVRLLILDEADEMLRKGFLESINTIYNKISSKNLQAGLFSATWGKQEQEITKSILNEPVIISLKNEDQTLKGLKQYYIYVGDKRGASADICKFEALCELFARGSIPQSVIFCNKVERAIKIQGNLKEKGFECDIFHSELPQEVRNEVIERFTLGKCRTLVSSGLLSRGMDVQSLRLVINFDVPHEKEIESYIHRIGRAGRFGRKGAAVNLVSGEDIDMIKKYENFYNTTIIPITANAFNYLE